MEKYQKSCLTGLFTPLQDDNRASAISGRLIEAIKIHNPQCGSDGNATITRPRATWELVASLVLLIQPVDVVKLVSQ